MIQYIIILFLLRILNLNLEKFKCESVFTIYPGSCYKISTFFNSSFIVVDYTFVNFQNTETILFLNNKPIISAINLDVEANKDWILICGGEYIRSFATLKVRYTSNQKNITISFKLYFGIIFIKLVSNICYHNDFALKNWYSGIN